MATLHRCPICARPVPAPAADGALPEGFPFCSVRCRTIDLGAWASDGYVVAGKPVGEFADADGSDRPWPAPQTGGAASADELE
jgi:uncharacterized protein